MNPSSILYHILASSGLDIIQIITLGYLLENNLLLLNINIVGYKVQFIIIKWSFESLNAVILDFRKKGEQSEEAVGLRQILQINSIWNLGLCSQGWSWLDTVEINWSNIIMDM